MCVCHSLWESVCCPFLQLCIPTPCSAYCFSSSRYVEYPNNKCPVPSVFGALLLIVEVAHCSVPHFSLFCKPSLDLDHSRKPSIPTPDQIPCVESEFSVSGLSPHYVMSLLFLELSPEHSIDWGLSSYFLNITDAGQ